MLTVVGLIDKVSIVPDSVRDWRETLEFVVSIVLASMTGMAIAALSRRMTSHRVGSAPSRIAIGIAKVLGRDAGKAALYRRAQKIQSNVKTIATAAGTLVAGAASFYTGIRVFLGH